MKALVTGGAGFIGSHLVERLLKSGNAVRMLDNFSTGRRENVAGFVDDVEVVEGDIGSYERAHRAVRGCDVVFHQAALPSVPRSIEDPIATHTTNVTGTLNILLAARDCDIHRVIFASSSSVYGPRTALPRNETQRLNPVSPYAAGKAAAEAYCQSFWKVYGLETVVLRYFNVFGPRQDPESQYSAVFPKFLRALLTETPPTVYGDGSQSRDFTYVENIVDANVLASEAEGIGGQVFNVACGKATTVNELIQELSTIAGVTIEPRYEPARRGDIRHSLADIGRATRHLGYRPRVEFCEGLQRTLDHYEAELTSGEGRLRAQSLSGAPRRRRSRSAKNG